MTAPPSCVMATLPGPATRTIRARSKYDHRQPRPISPTDRREIHHRDTENTEKKNVRAARENQISVSLCLCGELFNIIRSCGTESHVRIRERRLALLHEI